MCFFKELQSFLEKKNKDNIIKMLVIFQNTLPFNIPLVFQVWKINTFIY